MEDVNNFLPLRTADMRLSSRYGVGRKKSTRYITNCCTGPVTWKDTSERTKQRKMGVWIGLIRLRTETSDGLWKHGNEKSVPINAYIVLTNKLLPYQQEISIYIYT
jgi:hypothetical protein